MANGWQMAGADGKPEMADGKWQMAKRAKRARGLLVAAGMAAAVMVGASPARAGQQSSLMDGGSSNAVTYVVTATTNSPLAQFVCVNSSVLTLGVSFSCTASNGAAVTLRLDTSVDGSHWVTNTLAWPITATGTSGVSASTNLTVGATPFVRVRVVENPGPAGVTNLLVNGFTKSGI